MVGDTRVPSLIVIALPLTMQLATKVSLKTICCLRLLLLFNKHVMLQHQRK